MGTLHIAPGDSAGGSLQSAILDSGRNEEVLRNRDDLSCGPIDSDDPLMRESWWARVYKTEDIEGDLTAFWDRVATSGDRLVVWFGRHSASELAFFLALADRMGDRPFDIVDVTDLQWPYMRRDGSTATARPGRLSIMLPERLAPLIETGRPITDRERQEARSQWRRLRSENAPFRVVTPKGMESAPIDHFDHLLLERATKDWQRTLRVVADTMGYNSEPYDQVCDLMLLLRVVALVKAGKLLAEGDPRNMHASRVRLPD
jgi:hypothetical protein